MIGKLEDILQAIRKYHIDGTEGLEKAAHSLASNLLLREFSLEDEDKSSPILKHVQAWVLSLLLYITPSPYDIIGAVPDIQDFWAPKFEELITHYKVVEPIVCESSTIQEAVEKVSNTFEKQPQKSIAARKEIKALPASKEDVESSENDGNAF